MDAININSTEQLLRLNDTLKKYSISLSVFIFVSCLEYVDLNLTEIGDKIKISSAGMTTIRDSASDSGFIEEVKTDDRRSKIYRITDLGKELLGSARQ